jgi:hypothetical protein
MARDAWSEAPSRGTPFNPARGGAGPMLKLIIKGNLQHLVPRPEVTRNSITWKTHPYFGFGIQMARTGGATYLVLFLFYIVWGALTPGLEPPPDVLRAAIPVSIVLAFVLQRLVLVPSGREKVVEWGVRFDPPARVVKWGDGRVQESPLDLRFPIVAEALDARAGLAVALPDNTQMRVSGTGLHGERVVLTQFLTGGHDLHLVSVGGSFAEYIADAMGADVDHIDFPAEV